MKLLLLLLVFSSHFAIAGNGPGFTFYVTERRDGTALDSAEITLIDLADSSTIKLLTDKDGHAWAPLINAHKYKAICGRDIKPREQKGYFKVSAIIQKSDSLSTYHFEMESYRPDPAIRISNPHFDFRSAVITDTANLNLLATILIENPEIITLAITGHADCEEGDDTKTQLSFKRAQAIANYLTGRGVKTKMHVTGIGINKPGWQCPCVKGSKANCTEVEHKLNRFVEFLISIE